jgi:hypothetical protein
MGGYSTHCAVDLRSVFVGMRQIICADCGTAVKRNMKAGRARVCASCGVLRATQAALQMAARSGPAWDAFRARERLGGRTDAPRDQAGRFTTG